MLVSGCSWQFKSTTLIGGVHLLLYLIIVIVSLAYREEVATGVYLLIGGGVIFGAGVLLEHLPGTSDGVTGEDRQARGHLPGDFLAVSPELRERSRNPLKATERVDGNPANVEQLSSIASG